jgi:type IX secretion system PorP/SprF family membrane protein
MFNKLEFNPAFAGRSGAPQVTGIYRDQWLGLEGAPVTQQLAVNVPLINEHIGVGLTLNRHTIGISRRLTAQVSYAYAFNLSEKVNLSIGVSASVRQLQLDFTDDRLIATESLDLDPAVERVVFRSWFGNIGAGVYLSNRKWYVGLSAPRIVASDLMFGENTDLTFMEARNVYLMGGYEWSVNNDLLLIPQAMFSFVEDSPGNIDINVTAHLFDQFFLGLGYRSYKGEGSGIGESLSVMAGFFFAEGAMISLAYDIGLNDLRAYNSGSIELVLRYRFKPIGGEFVNPRFF